MTDGSSPSMSLFWVVFLYCVVQTIFALEINFSRNTSLFAALPAISVLFAFLTVRTVNARLQADQRSLHMRILAGLAIIALYLLATGFFAITAIFIGGLPG